MSKPKLHQKDNAWLAFRKVCDTLNIPFIWQYIYWETFYRPLINWNYED